MNSLDFISLLYEKPHTRESLLNDLSSISSSEELLIRAIPFSTDIPIENWSSRLELKTKRIERLRKMDGIHLFELRYFPRRKNDLGIKGKFFVYEHPEYPKVFVAITIEEGEFYTKVFLPFFKSLYPLVSMTFVTHKRFKNLIEAFQVESGLEELEITRSSEKWRIDNSISPKRFMSRVSWPNMTIPEAFDFMAQNNGWFQSVQLETKYTREFSIKFTFTRQGVVQTNKLFAKIFANFVLPVCKTLFEQIEFFKKRSRRDSPHLEARPICINFEIDQFRELDDNRRFIQALKKIPAASVSVFHGNPYIHLGLIDYFDGSSFDMWILDDNMLVVVPQMKGTIQSIKRVVNHIFDTYAEGEIEDYSRNA